MLFRRKSILDTQQLMTHFVISQLGFAPAGEIRMLTPGSGNAHNFFRDKIIESNLHTGIVAAEDALVSGRNDVLLVTPGSHAWIAALTWDKSNTHMLGMDPAGLAGYSRARFSHSGYTMANFMTASGDQNLFKNLRWMHGAATGGASDVTCITVSGAGNRFENCAFAGPNNATQAGSANYNGVIVSGSHNYFKNCIFGSVNDVDRSAANTVLEFSTGTGAWNIFENCLFRSRSGGGQATAYFIDDLTTDTVVDYTAIFLNCQFLHQGTALTLAINKAANTSRKLYFDNRCTFSGVTDIVADARNAEVIWGAAGASPDGSALNDKLYLGIAQTPIHTA
jgi:hypothetical protein